MTMDGTPRKAPLSAKKNKTQVQSVGILCGCYLQLFTQNPLYALLQMDRFIPARSAMDLDVANFNLLKENNGQANALETASPSKVCAWHMSLHLPPAQRHVVQVLPPAG